MTDARLSIRNLGKSFNVPVLNGIDLDIAAGEVHGIVGENGAGKSTLVNILTGLLSRDCGEINLDGKAHAPGTVAEGFRSGVSFAAQELSLIDTLTVAENIGLRQLPGRRNVIDRQALRETARRLLSTVGLHDTAVDIQVASLSLASRQLVEIAKAVNTDFRLLILDEPTASLTADQADLIHKLIAGLATAGTAVIYISHRLGDVIEVADRVTVLRDGAIVSTALAGEVTAHELLAQMTGESIASQSDDQEQTASTRPVLSARQVTTADLSEPVDLTCYTGQILGIAGLAGAGKSELLQALFGLAAPVRGRVLRRTDVQEVRIRSAQHAVRLGIGFLGEDRQSMGIFPGQSVLTNMMLPDLSRARTSRLDSAAENSAGEALRDRLAIRCDQLQQDIRELSGGNQQKVLLARWLNCDAEILLLDEPTRGIDVATKHAIYELFLRLKSRGKCLVIASSELEELMAVCDRIVVMSNRHMVADYDTRKCSEGQILSAAFSAYGNDRPGKQQVTSQPS